MASYTNNNYLRNLPGYSSNNIVINENGNNYSQNNEINDILKGYNSGSNSENNYDYLFKNENNNNYDYLFNNENNNNYDYLFKNENNNNYDYLFKNENNNNFDNLFNNENNANFDNLIYDKQNEIKVNNNDQNLYENFLSNDPSNIILDNENQFNFDNITNFDFSQNNQNYDYNSLLSNQNDEEYFNNIGTSNYNEQTYNNDTTSYNLDDLYNINNTLNNNNIYSSKTVAINNPPIPKHLNFMVRARGLANVGATCYMNATLQCFYHVKRLSENLINDYKIDPSLELTYSYKNLIEELAGFKNKNIYLINGNNTKDYVEPNEFKDLISRKNPLFNGIQANDSKDFVIFLLEGMDKELTGRNNKNKPIEAFNSKNPEQMSEANFKKTHNSIFSELFYGFQKSILECMSCGHKDISYNVINFLIFPLEKVYNTLKQNKNNIMNYSFNNLNNYMGNMNYNMIGNNNMINYMNYNMFNNMYMNRNMFNNYILPNNMNNFNMNYNMNNNYCGIVPYRINNALIQRNLTPNLNNNNELSKKLTLDDCFKENENEEILFGQNQIFCNHCKKYSKAKTKNELHKTPNIFILILNRGKGNYFQCDLDFPLQLDISKFVNNPSSPKNYELIGIISHLGKSSMEGHFIAFCKHFDLNWYLFNDGVVTPVSKNDIFRGTPYILFYQNVDLK